METARAKVLTGTAAIALVLLAAFPAYPATGTAKLGTDDSKANHQAISDNYGFSFISKDSSTTDTCTTLDKDGTGNLVASGGIGNVYSTNDVILFKSKSGNSVTFDGRQSGQDVLYTVWGTWPGGGAGVGASKTWTSQLDTKAYLIAYVNDPYDPSSNVVSVYDPATLWVELRNQDQGLEMYVFDVTQSMSDPGAVSVSPDCTGKTPEVFTGEDFEDGNPWHDTVLGYQTGLVTLTPSGGGGAIAVPTTVIVVDPCEVTVVFSKPDARPGVSPNQDKGLATLTADKITVTAVRPVSMTSGPVTISLNSDNIDRATIDTASITIPDGETQASATMTVKGQSKTPEDATEYDTHIIATVGSKQVGSLDVCVAYPRNWTSQACNAVMMSQYMSGPGNSVVVIINDVFTVTDQYNRPLRPEWASTAGAEMGEVASVINGTAVPTPTYKCLCRGAGRTTLGPGGTVTDQIRFSSNVNAGTPDATAQAIAGIVSGSISILDLLPNSQWTQSAKMTYKVKDGMGNEYDLKGTNMRSSWYTHAVSPPANELNLKDSQSE